MEINNKTNEPEEIEELLDESENISENEELDIKNDTFQSNTNIEELENTQKEENLQESIDNNQPELLEEQEPEKQNKIKLTKPKKKNDYYGFLPRLTKKILLCCMTIMIFVISLIIFQKNRTKVIQANENTSINYQVCLNENKFYNTSCLEEGLQYVTSLTKNIRVDFNYNKVFQEKTKANFEYYITTKMDVKLDAESGKELFKKEEKILDNKKVSVNGNVLSFVESIDIPFQDYNDYIIDYMNEYAIIGKSNLKVSLFIKDEKGEREVSSLTIPLKELTYGITKSETSNNMDTHITKSYGIVVILSFIVLTISLGFSIYNLYKLTELLSKSFKNDSKYDKKLKQILTTYDKVIVTLKDNNMLKNSNDIYTVTTFLELLDVRDTVNKPILYFKVNNVKSEFYVQDIDRTYKYTLKEADIDE